MVIQAPDLEVTRNAILAEVKAGTTSPPEVIRVLKERGLDEDLIRGTIWFLIDEGLLDLSWDLKLAVPQAAAA